MFVILYSNKVFSQFIGTCLMNLSVCPLIKFASTLAPAFSIIGLYATGIQTETMDYITIVKLLQAIKDIG